MTGISPRFGYPTSSATPAVSPAYSAGWTTTALATRRTLIYTGSGASVNNFTITKSLASVHSSLIGQFVGAAIPSNVVMSGTAYAQQQGSSTGNGSHQLRMIAKVVSGDGTTLRGVLFDSLGSITVSGSSTQSSIFSPTLSEVSALAGDRIVVEIGASFVNAGSGGNAVIRVGEQVANYLDLSLIAYGPSLLTSENAEYISSRTAPPANLTTIDLEVLRTTTAPAANLTTLALETISPAYIYAVSVFDSATPVEQLHTDGIWRKIAIVGGGA